MTVVLETTKEPGMLTETGEACKAGQCISALILTATANATAVIDDKAAGSGTNRIKLACLANSCTTVSFPKPIFFPNGAYATLSGTGAVLTVVR